MGHLFRTWFLWGFWGSVFTIALFAAIVPLYIMCKKHLNMIKMIGGITYSILFCNTAAWFLLGFFWRFSKAGRISAGEKIERPDNMDNKEYIDFLKAQSVADGYQLKGGKFMSVFLWLVIGTTLVGIAVGSVLAVIMCMKSNDEAGPKKNSEATSADTTNADAEANKGEETAAGGTGDANPTIV